MEKVIFNEKKKIVSNDSSFERHNQFFAAVGHAFGSFSSGVLIINCLFTKVQTFSMLTTHNTLSDSMLLLAVRLPSST